jgi:hypothetical protein
MRFIYSSVLMLCSIAGEGESAEIISISRFRRFGTFRRWIKKSREGIVTTLGMDPGLMAGVGGRSLTLKCRDLGGLGLERTL